MHILQSVSAIISEFGHSNVSEPNLLKGENHWLLCALFFRNAVLLVLCIGSIC